MILVTGANGTTGSHVVTALADAGIEVRAFVRDQRNGAGLERSGVEVVIGDFHDAQSLDAAVAGVQGIFLLSPTTDEIVGNEQAVIDAALRSGRPHVVKLSAINATLDAPVEFLRMHAEVVERLKVSGLPYTILQPNDFMQNFLRQAGVVHDESKIVGSLGGAAISHIDTRDVAAVARHVFTTDGHDGATYELTGPEALTRAEVAARISNLVGRDVRYEDIPLDRMRETLLADELPAWLITQAGQQIADYRTGSASRVTSGVEELLGRPATSIDEFLRDHRGAFEVGVGGRWP